ncbi:MAG: hypothetical protein AB7L71_00545 [Vicinamibacterales bacterium]
MPEDRKRQALPSERLREVLARLDDVLAEAERLRDEVTRQLDAQHQGQQQHLAAAGRKRARKTATRAPGGRGRRTGG